MAGCAAMISLRDPLRGMAELCREPRNSRMAGIARRICQCWDMAARFPIRMHTIVTSCTGPRHHSRVVVLGTQPCIEPLMTDVALLSCDNMAGRFSGGLDTVVAGGTRPRSYPRMIKFGV